MKGETADELRGLLTAMRAAGERVPIDPAGLVDVVGTGGDRSHSINVSSLAALVVAGAGVPVCKHGNRAASSACGSADVLERSRRGHRARPGRRRPLRRPRRASASASPLGSTPPCATPGRPAGSSGCPTVFNSLGPMANPAGVRRQVIGVADWALAERMIDVLAVARLGAGAGRPRPRRASTS